MHQRALLPERITTTRQKLTSGFDYWRQKSTIYAEYWPKWTNKNKSSLLITYTQRLDKCYNTAFVAYHVCSEVSTYLKLTFISDYYDIIRVIMFFLPTVCVCAQTGHVEWKLSVLFSIHTLDHSSRHRGLRAVVTCVAYNNMLPEFIFCYQT